MYFDKLSAQNYLPGVGNEHPLPRELFREINMVARELFRESWQVAAEMLIKIPVDTGKRIDYTLLREIKQKHTYLFDVKGESL